MRSEKKGEIYINTIYIKGRLIVDSWRKVMNAQYIDKDLPRGFQSRENSSFPIDRLSSEGMSTRCRHAYRNILNFRTHEFYFFR